MEVNIHFNFQKVAGLRDRSKLKSFISKKIKNAGRRIENIDINFCSDAYILNINQLYLKHNYFTDIISFDYSEDDDFINADIYISIDRVKENAKGYGSSIREELHRVIFHGMLHLLGYKDKTQKDKLLMRSMEDRWLRDYWKTK